MNYGEKVKTIRRHLNLTQEDLAKELNMSRSNISMIEKGERGVSLEVVNTFADKLKVDPRFFTGHSEDIFLNNKDKTTDQEMWKLINEVNKKLHPGEKEQEIAHLLTINEPLAELISMVKGKDANVIKDIKNMIHGYLYGIESQKGERSAG